jgi:hypothetical protein
VIVPNGDENHEDINEQEKYILGNNLRDQIAMQEMPTTRSSHAVLKHEIVCTHDCYSQKKYEYRQIV